MSIREAIGEPFSCAWRARFACWLEPARRALSEEATAAAWAEGAALSDEQAIAYALRPSASDDVSTEGEPSGNPPTADEPVRRAARRPRASSTTSHVTLREREVAGLIARGLTNRQIAAALVVAEGTVANHVKSILARLGFDSRVQIAAWAIERGLHQHAPA
jgi:non-specific serine/threonine protein kinase